MFNTDPLEPNSTIELTLFINKQLPPSSYLSLSLSLFASKVNHPSSIVHRRNQRWTAWNQSPIRLLWLRWCDLVEERSPRICPRGRVCAATLEYSLLHERDRTQRAQLLGFPTPWEVVWFGRIGAGSSCRYFFKE